MAMLITTHHLELWDTTNAQVKYYLCLFLNGRLSTTYCSTKQFVSCLYGVAVFHDGVCLKTMELLIYMVCLSYYSLIHKMNSVIWLKIFQLLTKVFDLWCACCLTEKIKYVVCYPECAIIMKIIS
jgi:hypothetical protein